MKNNCANPHIDKEKGCTIKHDICNFEYLKNSTVEEWAEIRGIHTHKNLKYNPENINIKEQILNLMQNNQLYLEKYDDKHVYIIGESPIDKNLRDIISKSLNNKDKIYYGKIEYQDNCNCCTFTTFKNETIRDFIDSFFTKVKESDGNLQLIDDIIGDYRDIYNNNDDIDKEIKEINSTYNVTFNDLSRILKDTENSYLKKIFKNNTEFKFFITFKDENWKDKLYEIKNENLNKPIWSYMRPICIQVPKYCSKKDDNITDEDFHFNTINNEFFYQPTINPLKTIPTTTGGSENETKNKSNNKKCCC